MNRRALSELEGCVLGIIGLEGPVTAYAIGSVFLKSPSPQWSGSAGAIYPLVKRLQRARLILSAIHFVGRRRSKVFSLTRSGRKAFVDWVNRADDDFVGGVPPDPLRTRVRFLGLLDSTSCNSFLRKARTSLERQLEVVREDCKRTMRERGLINLIARGAFATMESRHRWLYEVEKELRNTRRKTK